VETDVVRVDVAVVVAVVVIDTVGVVEVVGVVLVVGDVVIVMVPVEDTLVVGVEIIVVVGLVVGVVDGVVIWLVVAVVEADEVTLVVGDVVGVLKHGISSRLACTSPAPNSIAVLSVHSSAKMPSVALAICTSTGLSTPTPKFTASRVTLSPFSLVSARISVRALTLLAGTNDSPSLKDTIITGAE
jgi:hypothetical protein